MLTDGLGNNVDHAQEGARHVKGRVRPANHFDAVNQIDVNRKLCTNQCFVKNIIVRPMTIDEQQNTAIVISGPAEPPNPEIAVIAVRGHIESGHIA